MTLIDHKIANREETNQNELPIGGWINVWVVLSPLFPLLIIFIHIWSVKIVWEQLGIGFGIVSIFSPVLTPLVAAILAVMYGLWSFVAIFSTMIFGIFAGIISITLLVEPGGRKRGHRDL